MAYSFTLTSISYEVDVNSTLDGVTVTEVSNPNINIQTGGVVAYGVPGPAGAQGVNGTTGSSATIHIGLVTTGSTALVTNTGSSSNAYLNFQIPYVPGPTGPQGAPASTFTNQLLFTTSTVSFGNLTVSGQLIATTLTVSVTTITQTQITSPDIFDITNTTNASSTTSGALQVVGGVGVGGNIYSGGTIYSGGLPLATQSYVTSQGYNNTASVNNLVLNPTGNINLGAFSILGYPTGPSLNLTSGATLAAGNNSLYLKASLAGSTATWTFNYNSGLTFPDATAQTTAWKGVGSYNLGNFANTPGYNTTSSVNALIASSLTNYTTTATVNSLIASSLTNYATQNYVTGLGYATTATVNSLIASSLTNYATQNYVTGLGYATTATVNSLIANTLTNFVYTGTVAYSQITGIPADNDPYTTTATVNSLIASSLTNYTTTASVNNLVRNPTGNITLGNYSILGTDNSSLQLSTNATIYSSGTIVLQSDNETGNNLWAFTASLGMVWPDNTQQTTAWKGVNSYDLNQFTNSSGFITSNNVNTLIASSLTNYALQSYVTGQGYLTSSTVNNYVIPLTSTSRFNINTATTSTLAIVLDSNTDPIYSTTTMYAGMPAFYDNVNKIWRYITNLVSVSTQTLYTLNYLVVAGGGAGGGFISGGGGAGGLLTGTLSQVHSGTPYTITVGSGGNAPTSGPSSAHGGNGNNSSIGSLVVATGGGGGAGWAAPPGNGGSGGGGSKNSDSSFSGGTGIPGQGNNGGSGADGAPNETGGGGGGAGAAGSGPTPDTSGGVGLQNSITGSSVYYAGGGAGGTWTGTVGSAGNGGGGYGSNSESNGGPGSANTGGGGGGGGYNNGAGNSLGGNGGSGIVIISYAASSQLGSGGSVTTYTSGPTTYYVHSFTASGTFTF